MSSLTRTSCCALRPRVSALARIPLSRSTAASRSRQHAVNVVAFRDSHRCEQLTSLADEFLNDWRKGVKEGPTPEIMAALDTLTDKNVSMDSHHPLTSFSAKGLQGLQEKLLLDKGRMHSLVDADVVVHAVNDDNDVIFALLEYSCAQCGEGMDQKAEHKHYVILKMDALYDDTAKRITAITERGVLNTNDMKELVAKNCPEDSKGSLLTTPYPLDHIKCVDKALDPDQTRAHALAWCRARSTCVAGSEWANDKWEKEEALELDEIMDHERFQMWCPYAVMRQMCTMAKGDAPQSGYPLSFEGTKQAIHDMKEQYEMHYTWMDTAVSQTHNVAFTHWKAKLKKRPETQEVKGAGEGAVHFINTDEDEFTVQGYEVNTFNDEGKLMDIWMFRDPMDFEREMLTTA